ncbi:hypothetical protein MMC34_001803 [Xylographa carneopallida]|nr:hypothetical protein [Xylographa carneopallida]
MDFFDWENAVASDPGELSEMLASIAPLDVPACPPRFAHPTFSEADLFELSISQWGHPQDNFISSDPSTVSRSLEWPSPQPVDLEGPAEHNVSRVPLDHINIAHNNLRLAPKSLQCTKSNTDLLSMGTTRPRKNSGTGAKPSLPAIRILKDWVQDHARHPYPTELEREELKVKTGLRKDQISNWLANARRRGKVPTPTPSSSSNRRRVEGPVPYAASTPIDIPMWGDSQPNSTLNPLDRWRNSPPEDEPASVSAISNAVASSNPMYNPVMKDLAGFSVCLNNDNNNIYAGYRAHSESSVDTGASSGSDWSYSQSSNQSHESALSRTSQRRQSRRRRKNVVVKQNKVRHDSNRPYEYVRRVDRHRMGEFLVLSVASSQPLLIISKCTNISRVLNSRYTHTPSFGKITFASIYAYSTTSVIIMLRLWIVGWPERVEHLAVHFKQGTTMKHWKGDHGFESRIEDIVENAVPPYMIQFEKTTPDPFSASSDSHRRTATLNADATLHWTSASQCGYLDLQKQLNLYIKEQIARDHVPTDHEIRARARILVYGGNDTWNQTRADIPEWLEHFKLRNGLMSLPVAPGRNAYVGCDKAIPEA